MEYLDVRRALGFKLETAGSTLRQFVHFANQEEATLIITDLTLRWATQPQRTQPDHWARRLGMVRRFAQYCHALDERHESPPNGLWPHRYRRKPPYIYSEQEINRPIEAAHRLRSATGLRPCTYATFLGLLAVTGLRRGEALHLEREDVDLTHGSLTIRYTKFGKTRWIAIHRSTQDALQQYANVRDQLWPRPHTSSFFLSEQGTPLSKWSVQRTFVQLAHQIGLRGPTDRYGPRLHDLRHSFAVRTLLNWYQEGVNVEQRMPILSAYLGHIHVNDTFWYLSGTPELLHEVTQRLDTDPEDHHHAN
jgi:integrase